MPNTLAASPASLPRLPRFVLDLLLALLFGGLFALSPLSSGSRLAISLAFGSVAALLFWAYRFYLGRSETGSPERLRDTYALSWSVYISVVLVLLLMGPAIMGLSEWYTESVWRNGHALFLPLMIFSVVRVVLENERLEVQGASSLGLPLLLAGCLLVVVDARLHTLYLAVLGAPLVVAGLVVAFLGPRWLWAMAVPLLLLLFFLPLPASLGLPFGLPHASTVTAEWLLRAMGFAVLRDGGGLQLFEGYSFAVTTRCGGFSILFGGAALAIALAALDRSWRRAIFLLAVLWPLTCLANGSRLAFLLAGCRLLGLDAVDTMLHGLSGIAAYLGAAFVLLLLAGRQARMRLFRP